MTIWAYSSQPCDTCMWEGGYVWEHGWVEGRQWEGETIGAGAVGRICAATPKKTFSKCIKSFRCSNASSKSTRWSDLLIVFAQMICRCSKALSKSIQWSDLLRFLRAWYFYAQTSLVNWPNILIYWWFLRAWYSDARTPPVNRANNDIASYHLRTFLRFSDLVEASRKKN